MGFKALEGVRVLEYCSQLSGPYCTKLMADLGAEVIHIEPPKTGDEARRKPPFPGDIPDPEKSGLFLFLNTNKLGITLDPQLPRGKEIFKRLIGEVDVLVEDRTPHEMKEMGLGYDDLRKLNPGLIMASITPFGGSGPLKDYKAYALNVSHVSGQGNVLPLPSPNLERAPTTIGGYCTNYDSGQTAAVAVLAALFSKGITGKGQAIEVSMQEASLSLNRVEVVIFANSGEVSTRKGPPNERLVTMMFPCKNGHVVTVVPMPHQWEALMKLVGYTNRPRREPSSEFEARADNVDALNQQLRSWAKNHTMEEICEKAQALSCPMAAVNSPEDVVKSEQMNARGFFAEVEHPAVGKLKMPAMSCHFSKTPFRLERGAPLLGEHNERIYCQRLGYETKDLRELEKAGVI